MSLQGHQGLLQQQQQQQPMFSMQNLGQQLPLEFDTQITIKQ